MDVRADGKPLLASGSGADRVWRDGEVEVRDLVALSPGQSSSLNCRLPRPITAPSAVTEGPNAFQIFARGRTYSGRTRQGNPSPLSDPTMPFTLGRDKAGNPVITNRSDAIMILRLGCAA